jgi:predicted heme/steroid binding protein
MTSDIVTYPVLWLSAMDADFDGESGVEVYVGHKGAAYLSLADATLSIEGRVVDVDELFRWFRSARNVMVQVDRPADGTAGVTHALFFSGDTPGFQ